MRLHYLQMQDYGQFATQAARENFIANDRHMSRHYVRTIDSLHSYIVIDDFAIDLYSDVRLFASTLDKVSLHAEFRIADGGLHVATWHRPVVKRLFWFGFPLHLTTHFPEDVQERVRRLRDEPVDGLPKTITLPPAAVDDAA